jgi:uncharacterized protein with NRDE domain
MCLITFGLRKHPQQYLVLVANRDEFYQRPTESSHWWNTAPNVLAGIDKQAGGTWMGVNEYGYWACITNVRAPGQYNEDAPSRGHLVKDYLLQSPNPSAYLKSLSRYMDEYNGFNLVLGNTQQCWYLTNSIKNHQPQPLTAGLYGLSNAQLDVPWPKVQRACNKLDNRLRQHTVEPVLLIDDMVDQSEASSGELPSTGVPSELEKKLSAMFIQTPDYGTRCTTALMIDYRGHIHWRENSYKPGSTEIDEITDERFSIRG